ncbi:hypothetical protein DL96DRAFT_1703595 [Flagelloscypha sp. PMI_526]|nr:hypothetical protein DL96DRAFT_1703595 [Flagelloscypha sp. PMI_526]
MLRLLFYIAAAATALKAVNAATPAPTSLWTLGPLDSSDELYAGFDQIQGVEYMRIYDGSAVGRTYSHHAIVEGVGERLFAAFSSAANDEDSMGQQVWLSTATQVSGSWKWGSPIVAIGSALLPNQTAIGDRNYTYWCSQSVTQRAFQPAAIVQYEGSVYLIAETADISCNSGTRIATKGAGRLAVAFSTSGVQLSKACWLVQNQVTKDDLYAQTPIGDAMCASSLVTGLGTLLNRPDSVPFTNSLLINSPKFIGSDGSSPMIEVTRAVWNQEGLYWQRHWRDSSSKTTYVLRPFAQGRNNDNLCASLLPQDGVHIDWAGVLHTNASTVIVPDSRAIKRVGFSYPHAAVIGDYMFVGYSEDKEDIIIAKVPLASLGK